MADQIEEWEHVDSNEESTDISQNDSLDDSTVNKRIFMCRTCELKRVLEAQIEISNMPRKKNIIRLYF